MQLREMKLKHLKEQPKLTREEIYQRYPSLNPNLPAHQIGTVSPSGVVTIERGPFVIDDFIDHGRLLVQFDIVKAGTVKLDGVLSLDGSPREVEKVSFDVRSASLTSLEGGPKKVTAMYVDAANLTSLKGAPAEAKHFWVASDALTSLKGIAHGQYEQAVFTGCKKVSNTDGLKGMRFSGYLLLPIKLYEVTEVPDSTPFIGYPARHNVARLMLVKGLTALKLKLSDDLTAAQVRQMQKVDAVLQLVLKRESSPKQRYLLAQQELIDAGFSDLVD